MKPVKKDSFVLEKTSTDQRIKNIIPSETFINEFKAVLGRL